MKFHYPLFYALVFLLIYNDSFSQGRRKYQRNASSISVDAGSGILLFTSKVGPNSGNAQFNNNETFEGLFGINVEKSLPENLLAIGGLRYSFKGGGIWIEDFGTIVIYPGEPTTTGTINYNYRLNYIEIPMIAAYEFGDHSYLGFGVIPGFLVSQKYVKQLTAKKPEKQAIDYANPFQVDLGIEGRMYLNDRVPLFMFLKINYGILNAFKEDTHNGYNTRANKASFYLGVSYRFKK